MSSSSEGLQVDASSSKSPSSEDLSPLIQPKLPNEGRESRAHAPAVPSTIGKDNSVEAKKLRVGIANDGSRFSLPETSSPMEWMKHPLRGSLFHWVWILITLFYMTWIPLGVPQWVFVVVFIFWRLAYNVGLGFVLWKQSQTRFLTKYFQAQGKNMPEQIKSLMATSMSKDYRFDDYPPEFNAWVAFRGVVEVVLALDLATYFLMCFVLVEIPDEMTVGAVAGYIVGIALSVFALWAKSDAYRVIGDFAWNWGDFFFLVEANLTFNRVFALFPHPMYTVGYAFFYGFSLLTRSYAVLYISLFAHFCQMLFLVLVEDPHIEKTYGSMVKEEKDDDKVTTILYDKQTGYFRRDLIVFKNFFLFRSSDIFTVIIFGYNLLFFFANFSPAFYVINALFWRVFQNGILGGALYLQSISHWWTQKFIDAGLTKQDAFEEWKRVFNLALTMNYLSMATVAIKLADFSGDFYSLMLRATLAALLIALNVWSSVSTYEVLGEFGWFYGDFFIEEVPSRLYYTGIYRYLNNPENVTGYAGYYGLALFSASFPVFALALFGQFMNFLFIRFVETPHMKKLYGDSKRESSGFTSAMKEIIKDEQEELKKTASKAVDVIKKTKSNLETLVKGTKAKQS